MKKKMNKKGFTLVELLAVVVILLAISVIAVSSISAAIERQKEKQEQATVDYLKTYAELYFDDYKNTAIQSSTNKACVVVTDLKTKYTLDDSSLKDKNDNTYSGCVQLNSSGTLEVKKDADDGSFYYTCQNYACVKENS